MITAFIELPNLELSFKARIDGKREGHLNLCNQILDKKVTCLDVQKLFKLTDIELLQLETFIEKNIYTYYVVYEDEVFLIEENRYGIVYEKDNFAFDLERLILSNAIVSRDVNATYITNKIKENYLGKDKILLNDIIFSILLENKKLLENNIEEVNSLYPILYEIKNKSIEIFENKSKNNLAEEIRDLEFKMQELYLFNKDENYHRYWLELHNCSCPKMDNMDYFGYSVIINKDCFWHGES